MNSLQKIIAISAVAIFTYNLSLHAQDSLAIRTDTVRTDTVKKDSLSQVKDLSDVLRKAFKMKPKAKSTGIALLPSIGYNPSFGFILGAKISGGKQFGDPSNTHYSIFALEGIVTSKGIISGQVKHNIFTTGNKWNYQGHWQIARYGLVDYGLGTGFSGYNSTGLIVSDFSTKVGDSAFPIQYRYIRLQEKIYRKIGRKWYAGGGIKIDNFGNIKDEKQDSNKLNTPHQRYSQAYGFDTAKYSANGIIFAVQFNSREHPMRSYRGFYGDLSIQFNQEWLGSTQNAIQLSYDIRKYFSLSKKNPEHVLAFWHWAVYQLDGKVPYLELPSTASDTYGRSGRGYTFSRFKGPSYACFETEWRFPISRNKLISGVCFYNVQTASDGLDRNIFEAWESAAGVGLRILFKKQSRTTLCVDLAQGKYGAKGFFFGLGEVF